MSLSDLEKTAKSAKNIWGRPQYEKFGPVGPPAKEQSCEYVNAYLTCIGKLTTEKRKVILGPFDTLEDARQKFGRPMGQQKIQDEREYDLPDPSDPLWRHTTKCNVSLLFVYDFSEEFQNAIQTTQQALSSTKQVVGSSIQSTVGYLWGKPSPSSSPTPSSNNDKQGPMG